MPRAPIDSVEVDLTIEHDRIRIRSLCRHDMETGVEMKPLTAVATAALTVIDMGKAADKGMVIEGVRLIEKPAAKAGLTTRKILHDQRTDPRRCPYISDRCSRGQTQDTSGPALVELARTTLNARLLPLTASPTRSMSSPTNSVSRNGQ